MVNMNEDPEIINPKKKNGEEEHEINLQYHFYLPFFAIIYLGSYFLPGIIFMLYFFLFFKPFFLDINDFFSLFTDIRPLLALALGGFGEDTASVCCSTGSPPASGSRPFTKARI